MTVKLSLRHRWQMERMARSSAPILIGPWVSEIGFETLYWLPFLQYLRGRFKLKRDRLIAVTRGGAGTWYDTPQSVELFDYFPPKDARLAMLASFHRTQSMKQEAITAWERTLIPHLASRLGLRRYHVLHPSIMYQTLKSWWASDLPLRSMAKVLPMVPMPVPAVPTSLHLPDSFVAVKFYERPTFPATQELKDWAQDLVDRLQTKVPIVLLNTGLSMDDHVDFDLTGPKILSLAGHVTAQNNLGVQSAVIARSRAFIGTYGGTMQLAVRLGKPAAGFFSVFKDTSYSHKLLTEFIGTERKQSVFIGRPEDASFVSQALSEVV